jgi:hypothetical protein
VLPGVVQVEWAFNLGQQLLDLPPTFAGMEVLKFQQLVRPGDVVELHLRFDRERQQVVFRLSQRQCGVLQRAGFAGEFSCIGWVSAARSIAGKPAPTMGTHSQCGSWLACDAGNSVHQVSATMHNPCALIPVYNHEAAVPAVVRSLLEHGLPCLLVDDGSSPACAPYWRNWPAWTTSR